MNKTLWRLFFALVLSLGLPLAAQAAAPSNDTSFLYIDQSVKEIAPYVPLEITIGLLDEDGRSFEEPPSGKVFFWVTRPGEDKPLPVLELVPLSIPKGLAMHPLKDNRAVIIVDAKGMPKQESFKVRLTQPGTYEFKCTTQTSADFFNAADPSQHRSELMTATGSKARTIQVGPTPTTEVGFLVVSPSINGIELGGTSVQPPRATTVKNLSIPVHEDERTATKVKIKLFRANGRPVGDGLPVYVTTSAKGITLAKGNDYLTNADGSVTVSLSGSPGENRYLGIRLNKNDKPVLLPLSAYTYHPQRVRLTIGANTMDVDGRNVALDAPAVVKKGRTYVPYRAIGEILGAQINYNQEIRTITTLYEDRTITMTLGFDHYAINERIIPMDATPYITDNNRTMVPLRFIANATGYQVQAFKDEKNLTRTILFSKA